MAGRSEGMRYGRDSSKQTEASSTGSVEELRTFIKVDTIYCSSDGVTIFSELSIICETH